jgi:hypothetical protein
MKNLLNSLSADKYFKLSDSDLEKEASIYSIGNYYDGRKVDRERIIDQLRVK